MTSVVAYPEVRSALAAASRDHRISRRRLATLVSELDVAWSGIDRVDVDPELADAAGRIVEKHRLRALDAIHLATALTVDDGETVMVAWDEALRDAAESEGLALSPA